jgi:mannose/fructose/N-acetylgalactosamine-specific phosphotransferase system component IIC
MFTRRFAQPAATSAARRALTDAERAGVAGAASGLLTGNPTTALLIGGGTLLAFAALGRNRHYF